MTKFYNIDTNTNLGGENTSDIVVSSQKAIKTYVDNGLDIAEDHRLFIYRSLTGNAAKTSSPYYCARWDVTDENVTEYFDGMVVCLKIPVAGNGTYGTALQINELGYKPVVYNVSSMISTRYSVGSVLWCVYNATQTAKLHINSASASTITGCWQVMDYNSDTNTTGYQLRTNSSVRPVLTRTGCYRLLFSNVDNTKWVPANTEYDNSATSRKTVNQNPINPFGRIVYCNVTTNFTEGTNVTKTSTWDQYAFSLGYSFNTTGTESILTSNAPVYIKCAPQDDGSAIIDSTTPYVQSLPTTDDGKIYIYLGHAYSTTDVELVQNHPVFWCDGTALRLWTGKRPFSGDYGAMVVNFSRQLSKTAEYTYVCDTSVGTIIETLEAGKLVIGKFAMGDDVYYFLPSTMGETSVEGSSINKYVKLQTGKQVNGDVYCMFGYADYDISTGKWSNEYWNYATIDNIIENLKDVHYNIPVSDGQVLVYNATDYRWENANVEASNIVVRNWTYQ